MAGCQQYKELVGCCGVVKCYISNVLGVIKYKSKEILFHEKSYKFPTYFHCSLEQFLPVGKQIKFDAEYLNVDGKTFLVATQVWRKKKCFIGCSSLLYKSFIMENWHMCETHSEHTDLYKWKSVSNFPGTASHSKQHKIGIRNEQPSQPELYNSILNSPVQLQLKFEISNEHSDLLEHYKNVPNSPENTSQLPATTTPPHLLQLKTGVCNKHSNSHEDYISVTKSEETTTQSEQLQPKIVNHKITSFPAFRSGEITFVDINYLWAELSEDMDWYAISGLTGIVTKYLSNDFAIIKCVIDDEMQHMFFPRSALLCSRDISAIPLSTIMHNIEAISFLVKVYILNNELKFFYVKSASITDEEIDKLLSSSQEVPESLSSCSEKTCHEKISNTSSDGFVILHGRVTEYYNNKEGVIESEVKDVLRKFIFKRENVSFTDKKYRIPMKVRVPEGTPVIFSIPHINESSAYFVCVHEETFTENVSAVDGIKIEKVSTFFKFQRQQLGRIVAHVSDEEGIIMCKIYSVNCLVYFQKSDTKVYKKCNNFKLTEIFPLNDTVYFDVKITCFGECLKVDILNIVHSNNSTAVVTEVHPQSLSAITNKCNQEITVDVPISLFSTSGIGVLTKECDLTHHVFVGDKISLELKERTTSSGETKWIVRKAEKLKRADTLLETEMAVQNLNSPAVKAATVLSIQNNINVECESFDSKECKVDLVDTIEGISVTSNIQQLKLIQPVVVNTYEILGIEGKVVSYLSNDLGIVLCDINYQSSQHVLVRRSSLVCSEDLSILPMSSILPVDRKFILDIEVLIHEDGSQLFQVKTVKISNEINRDLMEKSVDNKQAFSTTCDTDISCSLPQGFIKLKGKILHVTHDIGIIKYELFGTVKHTEFHKDNVYFPGNRCGFVLKRYMPKGTRVFFCGTFKKTNSLDSLDITIVWIDSGCQTHKCCSHVNPELCTDSNKTMTFCSFQRNVIGTVVGHVSDDIGVIQCKFMNVNMLVQFNKKDTVPFLKDKNFILMEYFPVGETVCFISKFLCVGEFLYSYGLHVRGGNALIVKEGIVTEVCSKSLKAVIKEGESMYYVEGAKKCFQKSDNICLKGTDNLKKYVSVGNEIILEMKRLEDGSGWDVFKMQKSETKLMIQKKKQIFKGSVHHVGIDVIVLYEEQLGLKKYTRENISLFGIPLGMFPMDKVFKKGDILEYILYCNDSKLCIGPNHNAKSKDQVRLELYDYCKEKKFNLHIIKSLIENFDSYYTLSYINKDDQLIHHEGNEDISISEPSLICNSDSSAIETFKSNSTSGSHGCEQEFNKGVHRQKKVNILHPHIANLLKSCIEKKINEYGSCGLLFDVNVNEVIETIESSIQNLLSDDLLGNTIVHAINNKLGITRAEKTNIPKGENTAKAVFNTDVLSLAENVEYCINESVEQFIPSCSENSTQTVATGPVYSLDLINDGNY